MLYDVYCKRNNMPVGWISFEADTPEMAADLARGRGWEVEMVRRANAGAGRAARTVPSESAVSQRLPVKLIGCLAAACIVLLGVVAVVVLNLPRLKEVAIVRSVGAPPAIVSRCAEPTGWYIGEVDPRFDVSHEEIQRAVERAAALWQAAWGGGPLFVYDEAGEMPIHLKFDERLYLLGKQRAERERRIEQYNKTVEMYNDQMERFNNRARAWQASRDRDEVEKFRLDREEERLAQMHDRLRREEQELQTDRPRGVSRVHTYGDYREQTVTDETTGRVVRILDRAVTIYYFDNLDHLAFIVAHELGHALLGDQDHLKDETALMHATPVFPEDGQFQLSEADIAALMKSCASAVP